MTEKEENSSVDPSLLTRQMTSQGLYNLIDVYAGRRMRLRRTLIGLSQLDVADALGISCKSVDNYERGYERIHLARLLQIGRILHVSPCYFYDNVNICPAHATHLDLC